MKWTVSGSVLLLAMMTMNSPVWCKNYSIMMTFSDQASVQKYFTDLYKNLVQSPDNQQCLSQHTFSFMVNPATSFYFPISQLANVTRDITNNRTLGFFGPDDYFLKFASIANFQNDSLLSNSLVCSGQPCPAFFNVFGIVDYLGINVGVAILRYMSQWPASGFTDNTALILNRTETVTSAPWTRELPMSYIINNGLLNGPVSIFYYNDNAASITQQIFDGGITNIIMIVRRTIAGLIVDEAKQRNLFGFKYRWVIVNLEGSIGQFSSTLNVNSTNVTTAVLGSDVPLSDAPPPNFNTTSDILVYDALVASTYYVHWLFCPAATPNSLPGVSGDFQLNFGNQSLSIQRLSYKVLLYSGLGDFRAKVGSVITDGTGSFSSVVVSMPLPVAYQQPSNADVLNYLKSKLFKIIVPYEPPFVMFVSTLPQPTSLISVQDYLTGFSIDLLKQMLAVLGVTAYQIDLEPLTASGHGSFDPNTGQWSGPMGKILAGTYDMTVGDMVVTTLRSKYVAFITGVKTFTVAFIYNNLTSEVGSVFNYQDAFYFLTPFTGQLWGIIVAVAVGVTFAMAVLNAVSPNKPSYNLYESLFFSFGSLMHGVTKPPPNKLSARILICFWWFFCIIFFVIYVSNYAAIRTTTALQAPMQSFDDLINQNKFTYGTVRGTGIDDLLNSAATQTMQVVNKRARYEFNNTMVANVTEGINLAKNSSYAFIWHYPTLLYYMRMNCWRTAGQYKPQEFGMAFPKGSLYFTVFSRAFATVNAAGNLSVLDSFYFNSTFNESCYTKDPFKIATQYMSQYLASKQQRDTSLGLDQMVGIFFIMIGASLISLILSLIEMIYRMTIKKMLNRQGQGNMSQIGKRVIGISF